MRDAFKRGDTLRLYAAVHTSVKGSSALPKPDEYLSNNESYAEVIN